MKRIFLLFSLFSALYSAPAQNLTLLSTWDDNTLPVTFGISFNEIYGWHNPADDREYAIMGSLEYTYFIDITDPYTPIVADRENGRDAGAINRSYQTYGKYCYGVADQGNASLQIFDMSYLPDSVHKVYDSNFYFDRAHTCFVNPASGLLYVAGSNTSFNSLWVFDIATNPEVPVPVYSGILGHYTHDLHVRNDTAWCNNGWDGLYIYDFTTPSAPVLIGQMTVYIEQGYCHSSWLNPAGTALVMCDETHGKAVKVVDATDPTAPSVLTTFKSQLLYPADSMSIPHNPYCIGKYTTISYYHDGIQIWDISDPAAPVHAAGYDTEPLNTDYAGYAGAWGVYPFLPSGVIIASDVNNGLFVFLPDFAFPFDMGATADVTPEACVGTGDGSITASGTGGNAPYSYLWSTGDTTATISGLAPGDYFLTVTDRWGRTYVDTFTVSSASPLSLITNTVNSNCYNDSTGSISAFPIGGTGPYTYLWSNGGTTDTLFNVPPGVYSVTVTDSFGCTITDIGIVFTSVLAPVPAFTYGSSGGFTASFTNASTGTGLTYLWNFGDPASGAFNTSTAINPSHTFSGVGTYTVCLTVTDSCGSDSVCDVVMVPLTGTGNTLSPENISVFPNPAGNVLNMEMHLTTAAAITWTLCEMSGRVAAQGSENAATVHRMAADVSALSAGMYFLHVQAGGNVFTTKVIVTR